MVFVITAAFKIVMLCCLIFEGRSLLRVRIFCREQREILRKKMMIGEERKNSRSMREGER